MYEILNIYIILKFWFGILIYLDYDTMVCLYKIKLTLSYI